MEQQIIGQLIILIFLGAVAAGSLSLAKSLGFFSYLEQEELEERIFLKQIFVAFAIFFIVQLLIVPAFSIAFFMAKGYALQQIESNSFIKAWVNFVSIITAFSFLLLYAKVINPQLWPVIWRAGAFKGVKRKATDFIVGISTWFVCFPLVGFLGQVISLLVLLFYGKAMNEQVAVQYLKQVRADPITFGALALSVVLIVPTLEELLFRGFMQTWMRGIIGRTQAIFLTSFIFAGFHYSYSQGINNIELLSSLFVLSCFLGFIYERQNSLIAPIALHAVFNLGSVLMIILLDF